MITSILMGRSDLRRMLIVDLEATCWVSGQTPVGQIQEILEIGYVWLDLTTYAITGKTSLLIQPTTSTISTYCTSLTTITPQMVYEGGTSFPEALEVLRAQGSERTPWGSYGDFDRLLFERQCAGRNLKYPLNSHHINVKYLYALATRATKEVGMATALQELRLPLVGTHHRGADDAESTASILSWCLKRLQGC